MGSLDIQRLWPPQPVDFHRKPCGRTVRISQVLQLAGGPAPGTPSPSESALVAAVRRLAGGEFAEAALGPLGQAPSHEMLRPNNLGDGTSRTQYPCGLPARPCRSIIMEDGKRREGNWSLSSRRTGITGKWQARRPSIAGQPSWKYGETAGNHRRWPGPVVAALAWWLRDAGVPS